MYRYFTDLVSLVSGRHASPRMLLSFAKCTCNAQFFDARNNNGID